MNDYLALVQCLRHGVGTIDVDRNAAADAIEALREVEDERDKLRAALRALLALDVKGHQLQDRLQFSDAGRALLAQCRAALDE